MCDLQLISNHSTLIGKKSNFVPTRHMPDHGSGWDVVCVFVFQIVLIFCLFFMIIQKKNQVMCVCDSLTVCVCIIYIMCVYVTQSI